MPPPLPTDRFLTELHKMFEGAKAGGSVSLTTKRTNLKPRNTRKPDASANYVCLVRAADAKRKIATSVAAKDAPRFVESYGTILKAHVDGLKKREKAKKVAGGGAGGKK